MIQRDQVVAPTIHNAMISTRVLPTYVTLPTTCAVTHQPTKAALVPILMDAHSMIHAVPVYARAFCGLVLPTPHVCR